MSIDATKFTWTDQHIVWDGPASKAVKALADPRDVAERRLMAALENLMGEIDPETAARLAQGEMAPDLALKAETVPTEEVEPYDDAAEERIDDILKELAGGD